MDEVYSFHDKRHSGAQLDNAISSTSLWVMHLLQLHPTNAGVTRSWNVRLLHTTGLELPNAIILCSRSWFRLDYQPLHTQNVP